MALVLGGLAVAAVSHWLIANLAAVLGRGRLLHASPIQALAALWRLRHHPGNPRQAWPPAIAANLPGPVVYWLAAVLVLTALTVVAVWIGTRIGSMSGRREPLDRRRRAGVTTQARLATSRDLRPLLTRQAQPGRFLLARHGRRYVSTEGTTYRGRRGVQGAVAVFGPSQSGKTHGLIDGVEAWTGSAIVSSVKADLLRATLPARQAAGEVKVFDPLGVSGIPSAMWSPLRAARGLPGALAAAQILARAGDDEGPADRFWRGQAEQLIAAMLWTAANTEGHGMRQVVAWPETGARWQRRF